MKHRCWLSSASARYLVQGCYSFGPIYTRTGGVYKAAWFVVIIEQYVDWSVAGVRSFRCHRNRCVWLGRVTFAFTTALQRGWLRLSKHCLIAAVNMIIHLMAWMYSAVFAPSHVELICIKFLQRKIIYAYLDNIVVPLWIIEGRHLSS